MKNEQKLSDLDIGFIDDAITCISSLTASEHHLADSIGDNENGLTSEEREIYLDVLKQVRRDRSILLEKITPRNKGQAYCLVKHLSLAIENMKELANRFSEKNEPELSKEYNEKSFYYIKIIKVLCMEHKNEI